MKKSLLVILCFLLFIQICFGGHGSGLITRLYVHSGSSKRGPVVMFAVKKHIENLRCSGHQWAFKINTDIGKAWYALLLSAAAQQKPVIIRGSNDCKDWPNRERPRWIRIDY